MCDIEECVEKMQGSLLFLKSKAVSKRLHHLRTYMHKEHWELALAPARAHAHVYREGRSLRDGNWNCEERGEMEVNLAKLICISAHENAMASY